MTGEQVHQLRDDALMIRRSLDRATEQLARSQNALAVATAKLELLTVAIERLNHEQHPTPPE